MRTVRIVLFLTLATTALTFAQTTATTSDGRKVLLKDDGTWSHIQTTGQATITDFRNTRWGMNRSSVKSLEPSQPVQEEDGFLIFKGTISSLQTDIGYFFTDDILTHAGYVISEIHLNDNDHITDFNILKGQLTKKYGAPSKDETVWKNDRFKKMPDQLGHAISRGDLTYHVGWSTPRTRILLALYAESYKIWLILDYTSLDYGPLEEAEDLKDF